jgi:transcriptional regulator GlxA family with amidase domain
MVIFRSPGPSHATASCPKNLLCSEHGVILTPEGLLAAAPFHHARRRSGCSVATCFVRAAAREDGHHCGSIYVNRVFLTEAAMRAAVPYGRHLKIVRQIVKIGRTRIAERPLQISEFSSLLSIEHTAITRAFRAVHDCSPQVYLRNQRLIRARKRILLAREGATVKQIAAQFGFTEFGRFSVRYKILFGESPSVSLARGKLRRTRKRKV